MAETRASPTCWKCGTRHRHRCWPVFTSWTSSGKKTHTGALLRPAGGVPSCACLAWDSVSTRLACLCGQVCVGADTRRQVPGWMDQSQGWGTEQARSVQDVDMISICVCEFAFTVLPQQNDGRSTPHAVLSLLLDGSKLAPFPRHHWSHERHPAPAPAPAPDVAVFALRPPSLVADDCASPVASGSAASANVATSAVPSAGAACAPPPLGARVAAGVSSASSVSRRKNCLTSDGSRMRKWARVGAGVADT